MFGAGKAVMRNLSENGDSAFISLRIIIVKSQFSRYANIFKGSYGIMSKMKIPAKKRLFWYLKDGQEFDLSNPSHVDMYVQQVLSHGRVEDIREMLRVLSPESFLASFGRVKKYLSKEVRKFWEDGLGSAGGHPKGNPHLS